MVFGRQALGEAQYAGILRERFPVRPYPGSAECRDETVLKNCGTVAGPVPHGERAAMDQAIRWVETQAP